MVIAGVKVNSVNVSTKVLLRDGVSLIACEIVLILLINGHALHWWQGFILMILYFFYLAYMLISMKAKVLVDPDDKDYEFSPEDDQPEPVGPISRICFWLSGGPLLDLERFFVRKKQQQQIEQETWNGWPLLLASTAVIGAACWGLVTACEWLGTGPANQENPFYEIAGYKLQGFGMPAMFVAVIFASMATSVPDTVISIRDARDGDYDDAVANALGSNVFDICFALGFPLFLYTLIYGPIRMTPDVAQQSGELRLLLLLLTVCGFCIYYIGPRNWSGGVKCVEMKRPKAAMLLTLYLIFVVYIIARSQDVVFAEQISSALRSVLDHLPVLG